MAPKILRPRAAPGGKHQLEVHEVWKAVERLTEPGSGLTSTAALRVWAALWLFRDPETGIAVIERQELGKLAGISVARTSRILTSMEKAHMIRRRRERISGTQGPGKVIITIF